MAFDFPKPQKQVSQSTSVEIIWLLQPNTVPGWVIKIYNSRNYMAFIAFLATSFGSFFYLQQQKLYGFYSHSRIRWMERASTIVEIIWLLQPPAGQRAGETSTIVEIIWLLQPITNKSKRYDTIYNSRNYMAFIAANIK